MGHPTINPSKPVILLTSPPGEKRWGFYQFPDMWRAPGGTSTGIVRRVSRSMI